MVNDIMQLLRWRRKAYSDTLEQFVKHYMGQWDLTTDKYGNLYTRIGTAPILWSCHLDTVHRKEGWQNVRIDSKGMIRQKGRKSNCLGADDGAGIWLLLEMLDMRKEGLYIFHLDEEVGGKGSDWITEWNETLVKGIKYAVAFDRRSTHSIITNQYGVCCSDKFANSLSKELGMGHVLDTTGRFTDTDNYKELIPECTNVSVGYYHEHTPDEYLDFNYLQRLRDQLFKINVDNLVEDRNPNTSYSYRRGNSNRRGNGSYTDPNSHNYWADYNRGIREAQQEARRIKEKEEADNKSLTKTSNFNTGPLCKHCKVSRIPVTSVYRSHKDGYCSLSCHSMALSNKPNDEPVVISSSTCAGLDKYIVKPGDQTKTNIENIERLCSLNSRKMAKIFLDMGATYDDVLKGFLNLNLTNRNVARDDANKDGWLSMIAKFVLGGK